MRPSILIPLGLAAVFLGAALVLIGRDDESPPPAAPSAPPERVAPPSVTGKPNRLLGTLELEIVERPTEDRALVRASWTRAVGTANCSLEAIAPEGAFFVEGLEEVGLADEAYEGEAHWLLDFSTGSDLDFVVRLRGKTDRGAESLEAVVRLASAPQ